MTAFVATQTPVRAFVSTKLGGALRLSTVTRPTLPVPFTTELNRGEPVVLRLTALSAQSVSVGFCNTSLTGSGYEATHAYGPVVAAPVTTASGTLYSSAAGPLQDAFPSAKPHKPLVQFAHVPADTATITSRYVGFSLRVSDADTTTRGQLVEVCYSLDGGVDNYPYTAVLIEGDLPPYRGPECGGNEYFFLWDVSVRRSASWSRTG